MPYLNSYREVKEEDGIHLAEKHAGIHYEVSAADGHNIQESFHEIAVKLKLNFHTYLQRAKIQASSGSIKLEKEWQKSKLRSKTYC